MKIKIKTFNGELPDYLTLGKEYEILHFKCDNTELPVIHDDENYPIILYVHYCGHLKGGYWRLIDQVKTRSEANELADCFDDEIFCGDKDSYRRALQIILNRIGVGDLY